MVAYKYGDYRPYIHPNALVHPDAHICGDVWVGANAIIMPGASLRGDFGHIRVMSGAVIMDGAVLHNLPGIGVSIEHGAVVGSRSVVHSATVGRNAVVGDDVVLLDESVVGSMAMVLDGSLLTGGTKVPAGRTASGVPAGLRHATQMKKVRKKIASYFQMLRSTWPGEFDKLPRGNILFSG